PVRRFPNGDMRMTIWSQLYGTLKGGWKTYGPNSISGPGGFAEHDEDGPTAVNAETAMKLSAVWACQNLRAETMGTLPIHLRDKRKNILTDHPLYRILHTSPNANQTAPEYWSLCTAHVDMFGNAVSIIERGYQKKVV